MDRKINRCVVALALAGAITTATPEFTLAATAIGGATQPPGSTPPDDAAAAEQKTRSTTQPAPAGPPVLPLAGKTQPLKGPIQLEPPKVKKLLKHEPPEVTDKEVQDACPNLGSVASIIGYMKAKSHNCSTKAYSVQDQQAAGCKGNDTVEQCMEKLYDYCMSVTGSPSQEEFRNKLEVQIAASRKCAQVTQAYANYVEHMLDIYGK